MKVSSRQILFAADELLAAWVTKTGDIKGAADHIGEAISIVMQIAERLPDDKQGSEQKEDERQPDTPETIKAWLYSEASKALDWPLNKTTIREKIFGEIGGQTHHGLQQEDLKIAIAEHYLIQSRTFKHGRPLMELADLPKEDAPY